MSCAFQRFGNTQVTQFYNAAFHQENVTSVQPTSGRADTDGWLSTAEGQIWLDGQKALFPNADAEALYLDRVMNPSNWSAPRTLRIGIEANF